MNTIEHGRIKSDKFKVVRLLVEEGKWVSSLYEEWNFADTMTIQQVIDNRSPSMQPVILLYCMVYGLITMIIFIISLNAIRQP